MGRAKRAIPAFVGLLLTAGAQPVLWTGADTPPEFRFAGGSMPVRAESVEPQPAVTLLLCLDTVAAGEVPGIKALAADLFNKLGPKRPLTLAALTGQGIQTSGPFKTRAQLNSALQEAVAALPEAPATVDAARFLDAVAAVASQLGGGWSSVLAAANLPEANPELEEFAVLKWSLAFRAANLRFSHWSPAKMSSRGFAEVAALTAGISEEPDPAALVKALAAPTEPISALAWDSPATSLTKGFALSTGSLGERRLRWAIAPANATLPTIAEYESLLLQRKTAVDLAGRARSPEEEKLLSDAVNAVLAINPREPRALTIAAAVLEQRRQWPEASSTLAGLRELEPDNGSFAERQGHALFEQGRSPEARVALERALALKVESARLHEELARIQFAAGEHREATPHFDASLRLGETNQPLRFLAADSALVVQDWPRAADQLERGIALGGDILSRRTQLVGLFLERLPEERDRALMQVRSAVPGLPADATVRATYARSLERLKEPDEAQAVWRKTIEADPKNVEAHDRVGRIALARNRPVEALEAANRGIDAVPEAARLHLTKADIQESQESRYAARETLRNAAKLNDGEVLRRRARVEDRYGNGAPAYRELVAYLEQTKAPEDEIRAARERGWFTAIRDGDAAQAGWFRPSAPDAAPKTAPAGATLLPGGRNALMFMVQGKARVQPESFLAEYCRALVAIAESVDAKRVEELADRVSEYLNRVRTLEGLGSREEWGTRLELSAKDKNSTKRSEQALSSLGWRMKVSKRQILLEPFTKGEAAQRQEFASALALDEVGMQETLKNGQPFTLRIVREPVPVLGGEQVWAAQLLGKQPAPGMLFEAFAKNPKAARIYAGLASMDPNAAQAILGGVGLKGLLDGEERYLHRYGSAIALNGTAADTPGSAAAAWSKLAGADANNGLAFFRTLLAKDSGRMLAFYSTIAQLDRPHQRFFTASSQRLDRFYRFYLDSPEAQLKAGQLSRGTAVFEFFRDIPLTEDSHVRFPGSPEVWMVVKGQSNSTSRNEKLLRKANKTTAPEVEDEILLRLGKTRYKTGSERRTELENFLAVCRLDAGRPEPLTEEEAIVLAQHFPQLEGAWAYFHVLTSLRREHYEKFFAVYQKIDATKHVERNLEAGALHGYLGILCLLVKSGAVPADKQGPLFGDAMDRFLKADSSATQSRAWLESLRSVHGVIALPGESIDNAIARAVEQAGPPVEFVYKGQTLSLKPSEERLKRFKSVLEMQRITPLAALVEIDSACTTLFSAASAAAAAPALPALESARAKIGTVELTKETRGVGKVKTQLAEQQVTKLGPLIEQLKQRVARKNFKAKDLNGPVESLLDEIRPQIVLAMSGVIYAHYLAPEDLTLSEDPLLVRKHQFTSLAESNVKMPLLQRANFVPDSKGPGSYFSGGFADFSLAAGRAATNDGRAALPGGEAIAVAQLAGIRNTDWRHLRDVDLEWFGLLVRVGREWIVSAAANSELRPALLTNLIGQVSPTRRAMLDGALGRAKPDEALAALSLSDQYFLGRAYVAHVAGGPDLWDSPVVRALRELSPKASTARHDILGAAMPTLMDTDQTMLVPLPPYEEYSRYLLLEPLAERCAEAKLQIAYLADQAGLPAAALPAVSEKLALNAIKKMGISGPRDWRGVLAAWESLKTGHLEEVLRIR